MVYKNYFTICFYVCSYDTVYILSPFPVGFGIILLALCEWIISILVLFY